MRAKHKLYFMQDLPLLRCGSHQINFFYDSFEDFAQKTNEDMETFHKVKQTLNTVQAGQAVTI